MKFSHRSVTWQWWQFLFVVLSLSWLLGPSLNHHLSTKITFISNYEDPGQPWSWLYRTCDILAALLLGLAVWVIARRKRPSLDTRFYTLSLVLLAVIAAGLILDDVFPSTGITRLMHSGESVITTLAFIALNVTWVIKKAPWAKFVLGLQLLWVAAFIFGQLTTGSGNSLVQFGYQIAITLWVASIVPELAGYDKLSSRDSRAQTAVHIIAAWIFFGGFIAVVNSIRNLKEISQLSSAYFGNNTAWLSQHGVAVGVVLMYVSRHLWRGEYRAWQLTSALLWLETLKYAIITPDSELVLLYGLTASVLFVLRGLFNRLTSVEELRERLKKLALVAFALVAALFVGILALRLKHHQDLDSLKINFGQISQHFFLFDVVNDLGPLPHRLLGQVLNVAGLALLLAVLVSLFRPHKPLLKPPDEYDRRHLLSLLDYTSNSSEDYFKYWPQPKSYWWNTARSSVVAYQVAGNVAFALADPVTRSDSLRQQAMKEFLDYCRGNGWRACFLMIQDGRQSRYKQAGYKLFRIGASAVVDIDEFALRTIRNKWWRWVLNKAKKQDWQYELAVPPHKPQLIAELRRISDTWLQRQNHVERGFALGYFDKNYLQACRLHLLRQDDEIIAFSNELPTFNNLSTATIDLMRFLPEHNHAMPALLAGTINQLHREGTKQKFDLGFVPLASPTARTEQVIKILGQLLMSETVSAQGLEQFKNKFSPAWVNNYIAFDGDWIDLLNISRQLDNLLKI